MNTTTERILVALRTADGFVSGESLCHVLGISRSAVWKHVHQLRENGYKIESGSNRGYRLTGIANVPTQLEVSPLLKTKRFGRCLHYFAETESTNNMAAELARKNSPEGTVVIADHQTAGRGRLQRQWHSPRGQNLYFSLIVRPEVPPNQAPQTALIAGLALCRTIRTEFPNLEPRAKWPNDVYLNSRKLAGILCSMVSEMERVQHLIIGVGLNVNMQSIPDDLRHAATSLKLATGASDISRPGLLAAILGDLESAYDQWRANGLASFLDEWQRTSYLTGREVTIEVRNRKVSGRVCGIDSTGALQVKEPNGNIRPVVGGDVELM